MLKQGSSDAGSDDLTKTCANPCSWRFTTTASRAHACISTGIDCDMSVGGLGATFKCRVLRALATIDARFPAMVRIVKTWARTRGLNDSSNGTMNSFALSLLVRESFRSGSGKPDGAVSRARSIPSACQRLLVLA